METKVRERVAGIASSQIRRGRFREVLEDGTVVVADTGNDELIRCDTLDENESGVSKLESGREVLFVSPTDDGHRGTILGIVSVRRKKPGADRKSDDSEPEKLIAAKNITIVAEQNLVIRCGEGSISISEDGRVVLKGTRMLSRSKGVNKVKGAAVQIN